MMSGTIFALFVLAFFLPSPSVEAQFQAAWKNTDHQGFVSTNGQTGSVPPFLGQLLGGTNSLGDFLGLFTAGGLSTGSRAPPSPNNSSRASQAAVPYSSDTEEVQYQDGHPGNGTWITVASRRDDRPVPGEVDVGPDGLLYFKGNQSLTLDGCRAYCHGYRGFRLAMAKTNETMRALRSHGNVVIDLSIVRHKKTGAVKYVWGDGSELDGSLVRSDLNEPVLNHGGAATSLVMWIHGRNDILDDAPAGHTSPCLCQGSFGTSMQDAL